VLPEPVCAFYLPFPARVLKGASADDVVLVDVVVVVVGAPLPGKHSEYHGLIYTQVLPRTHCVGPQPSPPPARGRQYISLNILITAFEDAHWPPTVCWE